MLETLTVSHHFQRKSQLGASSISWPLAISAIISAIILIYLFSSSAPSASLFFLSEPNSQTHVHLLSAGVFSPHIDIPSFISLRALLKYLIIEDFPNHPIEITPPFSCLLKAPPPINLCIFYFSPQAQPEHKLGERRDFCFFTAMPPALGQFLALKRVKMGMKLCRSKIVLHIHNIQFTYVENPKEHTDILISESLARLLDKNISFS